MSLIDSAASVFRLACTVTKLCDIFGGALKFGCKFAFETNFCKFDPCNDPIPQFLLLHIVHLAEMRIFSCQASWYVSPVQRYARKRLSWKSRLMSPKWGVFGDNSAWDETYRWDLQKVHPWPKPRRLVYNMWDSSARGRLWACPRSHQKKNSANRKLHLYEEPRPPADHYELWPTWWFRRRNELCKFLFCSVKGFLFCEVLKMAISYT
jgi:hypothetical protein